MTPGPDLQTPPPPSPTELDTAAAAWIASRAEGLLQRALHAIDAAALTIDGFGPCAMDADNAESRSP